MPYYGDVTPYYFTSSFANHSSLMTGGPRTFHGPLRFSPHLSTITESPLGNIRRYSPVSVPTRTRRVIDTADIDVSTPRILSHDTGQQRNRLRRDRPTVKIRSQALKDNPALREHNEKHEKTVGELLVEKFLIKDKKPDEQERPVRLYHQVSLEDKSPQDFQGIRRRITRRMTRRRSSADLQLDQEELERQATYAQVQAKVLDSLVAEEQAEIENEARRGTLIRKNALPYFRTESSVSQDEEEQGVKVKKTLKKVKKKRKHADKPSPTDGEESSGRRSSVSSEVSTESAAEECNKVADEEKKPQIYKIEASNSVGDFSTVWINTETDEKTMSIEQFRESVRIPVPKKAITSEKRHHTIDIAKNIAELEEMEVVLPVRKPYVKDTSRYSVYLTVKTPQEKLTEPDFKVDKTENTTSEFTERLKSQASATNVEAVSKKLPETSKKVDGIAAKDKVLKPNEDMSQTKDIKGTTSKTIDSKSTELSTDKVSKLQEDISQAKDTKGVTAKTIDSKPTKPSTSKDDTSKTKRDMQTPTKDLKKLPPSSSQNKIPPTTSKAPDSPKMKMQTEILTTSAGDSTTRRSGVSLIASDTSENSANGECLPKPSKINTDRNNAVEAPELSLGEYLANSLKTERDEDVASSLPGKTVNKASTLAKTTTPKVAEIASGVDPAKSKESKRTETSGTTTKLKDVTLTVPAKTSQVIGATGEKKTDRSKMAETANTKLATNETSLSKITENEVPKISAKEAEPVKIEEKKEVKDAKVKTEKSEGSEKKEIGKIAVDEGKAATKALPKTPKTEEASKPLKTEEKTSGVKSKLELKGKTLPKLSVIDSKEAIKPGKDSDAPKSAQIERKEVSAPKLFNKSLSADSQKASADFLTAAKKPEPPKQSKSLEDTKPDMSTVKVSQPPKFLSKSQEPKPKIIESLAPESESEGGKLSKSESCESIDFWSEIKAPESPKPSKPKASPWSPTQVTVPKSPSKFSLGKPTPDSSGGKSPIKEPGDKKKETDLKISDAPRIPLLESNVPVTEAEKSEPSKAKPEETKKEREESRSGTLEAEKRPKKKKDLLIKINKDTNSTIKKAPLKREDSSASTVSTVSTADTSVSSVPSSEVSTPVSEISVPIINIVEAPSSSRRDSQNLEDEEEDPSTPTNEWNDSSLVRISKWSNQTDLSNVEEAEKDVTPIPSNESSLSNTPAVSPQASNKKKVTKKKKPSKKLQQEEKPEKKPEKKVQDTLKPIEKPSPKTSPRNTPNQRPLDLIKMFYTTPSQLLTATPRDLSKVRRAKIKRKKHQSRPPSVSSDSTGSTTSTTTTESTDGSGVSTELDDDPEHKRMNSTRSNDSGFDGSPRISSTYLRSFFMSFAGLFGLYTVCL